MAFPNQPRPGGSWVPRQATEPDIPQLEHLIALSAKVLQAHCYSPEQITAAMGPVFGVDRQLIRDGTYFVVESGGAIVGCGGWSRRRSLFGSDEGRPDLGSELDPRHDAARIRAFFVHPDWARQGVAASILSRCETEISAAGFRSAELVATLPGEPLYTAFGWEVIERSHIELKHNLQLPVVRMRKRIIKFTG